MRSAPQRLRVFPAVALLGALALAVTGCSRGTDDPSSAGDAMSPTTSAPAGSASSPATSVPGAPVQVFEDFSCPHCATFHAAYSEPLLQAEQDGEVEVQYRIVDFLGRGDPESWSTRAAQAYYCVDGASDGNAEALHQYQTWLFEQAAAGVESEDTELVEKAAELSGDAGVDIGQCVAEDGGSQKLAAALSDFSDAGLRGVPAVYADGTLYNADEHGELMPWLTGGSTTQG
jgi:protein-disulfide isomerase